MLKYKIYSKAPKLGVLEILMTYLMKLICVYAHCTPVHITIDRPIMMKLISKYLYICILLE